MNTFTVFVVVCTAVAVSAGTVNRRQGSGQFVAFSAGLSKDVSLATNSSVAFDKVFTNIGNGYNNVTGIFTAPVAGGYVIMFHGLSDTTGQMWLDLYKKGQYEVTAYAHNNNDYASASNTIVLQLDAGDQVFIKGHGDSQLYGRSDEIYSTFSGFILPQSAARK